MGMFDYVNVEIPCPYCGNLNDDYQSKDAGCTLETVDVTEVVNFYSSCNGCGKWVEFVRGFVRGVDTMTVVREKPYSLKECTEMGFVQLNFFKGD